MFTILQIIITVVVIYLIFSVIVYVIVEWVAAFLKLRKKTLFNAINNLFENRNYDIPMGDLIYRHPQVKNLSPEGSSPSYIPAANISMALIDIISSRAASEKTTQQKVDRTYEDYLTGVDSLRDGQLKELLTSIAKQSHNLGSLNSNIEKWFNDSMDRVTGWYKRKIKLVVFIVATIVTLSFNVDTIYIIQMAKIDPVLRQRINDLGDRLVADSNFNKTINSLHSPDNDYFDEYVNDSSVNSKDSLIAADEQNGQITNDVVFNERTRQLKYMNELLKDSDLPIGWGVKKDYSLLLMILGWVLTILALSAGAPFWFDLLKKLINIRSTGPTPSK